MKTLPLLVAFLVFAASASATEFHVATTGDNAYDGSAGKPLKTIQAAAELAQPGDTVTVHAGLYRERISPPRGGESDAMRITYQAMPGEKVVITGSEPVTGWEKVNNDTWKVIVPNSLFGESNPYSTIITGNWFGAKGRTHHTGSVYLNGDWHDEAAKLDDAMKPAGEIPLWFGQVDAENTTLWAQFPGVDPNKEQVEINVRPTVFTPTQTGINYITVRGFTMRNAATTWAPPTAKQIGAVTAYWCKGWIIENNDISYSRCCGIALGKYGDEWDNRAGSANGYVGTIDRALKNGWNKETIGSHIVRNNHIHHCEQTGIVGSLGCSFSTITGNTIHDIQVRNLFDGAEMGGIKFHGAIDTIIANNHIYRVDRGIWLDWMAQGAQVVGNLLHDNGEVGDACQDLFLEVNHGPILVANNIFLSTHSLWTLSHGVAFVHNVFAGTLNVSNSDGAQSPDPRQTPFFKPHSTEQKQLSGFKWGDMRLYNNIFTFDKTRRKKSTRNDQYSNDYMIPHVGFDLNRYKNPALPVAAVGNVYLKDTPPYLLETNAVTQADFDPALKLTEKADGWYLEIASENTWSTAHMRPLVTTELLGKALIPNQPFTTPEGALIRIDTDYFGTKRNPANPFPGPFETIKNGKQEIKVWPKNQ